MLYGGPLGTYLSGYYAPGSAKGGSPSNFPSSSSGSSGMNRSWGSRYRAPSAYGGSGGGGGGGGGGTPASSIASATSASNSRSNFYTPQTRRKYSDDSTESTATPSRSWYTSSGTPVSSGTTSGYYSRPTPSYATSTTPSSSSFSRAAESGVDYKRLYEAEKQDTQELRGKIERAHQELKDLKARVEEARKTHQSTNSEQRPTEQRTTENEGDLTVLEELRAASEKLKAENRALTRVISRLM